MRDLRLVTIPKFPGRVIGTKGIQVQDQNGNWTISMDYSGLALQFPYTPLETHYILVYDANLNRYFLAPATSFA
jgi:hypothetical protein